VSKQSKRNRNPIFAQAYAEGFDDGKNALVDRISERLQDLKDQPGIGPQTWKKIEDAIQGMQDEKI